MGKVRKNFYIGVRVPWTLASDRVWNDTHRLAAWVFVAAGVIGFGMIVLGVPIVYPIVVLFLSAFVPIDLFILALQIVGAAWSVVEGKLAAIRYDQSPASSHSASSGALGRAVRAEADGRLRSGVGCFGPCSRQNGLSFRRSRAGQGPQRGRCTPSSELENAGKVELCRVRAGGLRVGQLFELDCGPGQSVQKRASQQDLGPARSWPTRLTSRTSGCDRAQATTVARSCIWSAATTGLYVSK